MNLTKARELREKRAKLYTDARAIYDKTDRSAEDTTKFDAMMAEVDTLKTQIDQEERMESLDREFRGSGAPPNGQPGNIADNAAHIAEYRTAEKRHGAKAMQLVRPEVRATIEACHESYWAGMKQYLIGGDARLSDEARQVLSGGRVDMRELGAKAEYRDMGTGGGNALQGTGGGYFVPVGIVHEIESAMKYYGDMLNVATIMDTATGQPLPYPTSNDTGVTGELVGEGIQVSAADITLGNVTFNAYKYSTKMLKVSIELLQDSAFDLQSFAYEKFGERLGRITNTHFTTGTGTSQPNGLLTATVTGALAVTATGTSTNDGSSATGGTSIGSDDLTNLEHKVDPLYRRGSIYVFHDSTLQALKKVKDKYGRPLWVPGVAVNAPDTINNYGYSVNNDMPVIAVNAKTIVFGQVKKYMIRRVKELAILRLSERFADYGQVAFIGFARYDGQLLDAGTHPTAYLVQAAS